MTTTSFEAFPLGHVLATPGAMRLLDGADMTPYLARHMTGDFGTMGTEDVAANEYARAHGGRIMSAYTHNGQPLWVITEADRSSTTVLLPEEY